PAMRSWLVPIIATASLTAVAVGLVAANRAWVPYMGSVNPPAFSPVGEPTKPWWFPYLGNTPPDGFWVIGNPDPMLIGPWTQRVLTVVSCIAGGWLIGHLVRSYRSWGGARLKPDLLAKYTLIQIILLPGVVRPKDRYFLVLLPGVLACLAMSAGALRVRWRP